MRKFLFRSFLFFCFAGVFSVGVFFLLSKYSYDQDAVISVFNVATSTVISNTEEKASDSTPAIIEKVPEGGIALSSLPLTESHKKALSIAQIDVETFVLSEAMIKCAGEKIGDERMSEIITGNAPSILEMGKLIPCLSS